MSDYDRSLLVFFSDTHGGHQFGLLNPSTTFTEYEWNEHGEKVEVKVKARPGATQKMLWGFYQEDVANVFKLAKGDPMVVCHVGDPTQGNKYTGSMAYNDVGNQMIVAIKNWEPFLLRRKNVVAARLIWGTNLHEFKGSTQGMIADSLKAKYKNLDVKHYGHGLIKFGKSWFDVAHHGPTKGIRNWTDMNVFRLYCQSILSDAQDFGDQKPHAVLRGHFHSRGQCATTKFFGDEPHTINGLLLPSYQAITAYAVKQTKSTSKTVFGMLAVEMIKGEIHKFHWFTRSRENRIKEVL